jgi:hypothetical protein
MVKKKAPSCLEEGAFRGFYLFQLPISLPSPSEPGGGCGNGSN